MDINVFMSELGDALEEKRVLEIFTIPGEENPSEDPIDQLKKTVDIYFPPPRWGEDWMRNAMDFRETRRIRGEEERGLALHYLLDLEFPDGTLIMIFTRDDVLRTIKETLSNPGVAGEEKKQKAKILHIHRPKGEEVMDRELLELFTNAVLMEKLELFFFEKKFPSFVSLEDLDSTHDTRC